MNDIQYIGEHLLPGRLGHFLVITAFVSAILCVITFHKANKHKEDLSWLKFARWSWWTHTFSILSVIGLLFYMMISQMYEYRYVWDHVSDELPMKYIFSAFWEGQEGSFLLWMFWHVVLGSVVIFTAKRWEPGVLVWLALVEVVLVSMIAGIHFSDDIRLGSSPFLLIRETMEAPIFNNPNYLSMIEGNGLNPLLQNYWMTIHPPTLFLGFASVTIPFCFAMNGLVEKEHLAWMKPVTPWSLFSAGILGLGILMGGAWAYEALSFGGYWAWDPVENMSLVPWLVLLAAIHGNFIVRHTGQSIKTTYLFYILSFLLIVYSTFLTRSGILGTESVHAFTEMGLEWQLVGFIALFAIAGGYLMITRNKSVPKVEQEEMVQSREFWMFIGALILVFSSVLITFTTSIPVYNKLVDVYGSIIGNPDMSAWHRAMPIDDIAHHNRFQLWIAVLIGFLSGMAQVLRFKAVGWDAMRKRFFSHLAVSAVLGGALALLLAQWINLPSWQYVVLLIAASFGIVSNLDYAIRFVKGRWTALPSALAHGGFAIMLVGIMASGLNKRVLSGNRFAQEGMVENMDAAESTFLIKEMPMFMNGYWVTYTSDTLEGLTRKYLIEFVEVNAEGDTLDQFVTKPNVLYERSMDKIATANPNTKRYLHRDIFTYISGMPPEQQDVANISKVDSMLDYTLYELRPGDSIQVDQHILQLDSIVLGTAHEAYTAQKNDLVLSGRLQITRIDSLRQTRKTETIYPTLVVRRGLLYSMSDQINDFNLRARLKASSVDDLLPLDENLKYEPLIFKTGETQSWNGLQITMRGVDKNVDHPNYEARDGDIAIQGVFDIQRENKSFEARPLFYIREGSPYNMKAFIPGLGLHLRLEKIDPQKEEFHVFIAQPNPDPKLPVEIALEVPRNDYIVLQAIEFPGINLFWLGSVLMLSGMFLGMYKRLRKKKA